MVKTHQRYVIEHGKFPIYIENFRGGGGGGGGGRAP